MISQLIGNPPRLPQGESTWSCPIARPGVKHSHLGSLQLRRASCWTGSEAGSWGRRVPLLPMALHWPCCAGGSLREHVTPSCPHSLMLCPSYYGPFRPRYPCSQSRERCLPEPAQTWPSFPLSPVCHPLTSSIFLHSPPPSLSLSFLWSNALGSWERQSMEDVGNSA